jgi:hypothetical protein
MTLPIPPHVEDRIRRTPPAELGVVPGSTPVVAFGDVRTASVATLGLNPSRREFLDHQGQQLTGASRRLATLRSLGVGDLATVGPEAVEQVYADCLTYFQRNPYHQWFDRLEALLSRLGASYYDGSACHLDLVQWATDPTWGRLSTPAQRRLLETDAPFLLEQLQRDGFELLLANGRSVLEQFQRVTDITLTEKEAARESGDRGTARIFTGALHGRLRVVGWTKNLQSSVGLTNTLRARIAERVAELA